MKRPFRNHAGGGELLSANPNSRQPFWLQCERRSGCVSQFGLLSTRL